MVFKLPHTKYYPSRSTLLAIAFSFTIFLNFTIAIQYVNLNNFNMTLNEIVEEEEKEEHRNDLIDDLVNNTNIISLINYDLGKEPLLCRYHSDVLTPPPELS